MHDGSVDVDQSTSPSMREASAWVESRVRSVGKRGREKGRPKIEMAVRRKMADQTAMKYRGPLCERSGAERQAPWWQTSRPAHWAEDAQEMRQVPRESQA